MSITNLFEKKMFPIDQEFLFLLDLKIQLLWDQLYYYIIMKYIKKTKVFYFDKFKVNSLRFPPIVERPLAKNLKPSALRKFLKIIFLM